MCCRLPQHVYAPAGHPSDLDRWKETEVSISNKGAFSCLYKINRLIILFIFTNRYSLNLEVSYNKLGYAEHIKQSSSEFLTDSESNWDRVSFVTELEIALTLLLVRR